MRFRLPSSPWPALPARSAGANRSAAGCTAWPGASRKAGARAARQRTQALPEVPQADGDPAVHAADRELRAALDEEVGRLPVKERVPFVLCYLEGRTNAEAVRELGWPTGTVATRLSAVRERLRARLTRRGLALPAALTAAGVGHAVLAASAPAPLVLATIRNALAFAHGTATASLVSKPVIALAQGALRNMWLTRLRFAAVAFVAVGLIVTAATAAANRLFEPPAAAPAPAQALRLRRDRRLVAWRRSRQAGGCCSTGRGI